jgi:predicted O-methyltransferase YrrM
LRLLSLLPVAPQEFFDRVVTKFSCRWESIHSAPPFYDSVLNAAEAFRTIRHSLPQASGDALQEPSCIEIEQRVGESQASLPADAPFQTFHNGGRTIARLCYTVARAIRPKVVVECGVCYGVTTAYFLQALTANGQGRLHSIDLPPLGKNGDAYVGSLVPPELRHRWTLHRGTSRRFLRPLVASLKSIDIFLHDSLHTYDNMKMEFAAAWPALRPGGVLISDDVEGNAAFQELAKREDVAQALVFREEDKPTLVGIALKRP